MELGGKDPAYVCDDSNLDYAVENIVDGAFFNSGQCCCAIERCYVQESVYEEFVEKAVALTKVKKKKKRKPLGESHDDRGFVVAHLLNVTQQLLVALHPTEIRAWQSNRSRIQPWSYG
jgi:acyl-CoA reductase-like NAD-dependent aldehyde dehydrogenase